MKAHQSITEAHWNSLLKTFRQTTIYEHEYEEWRLSPVTRQLFAHLEYSLIESQTALSGLKNASSDDIFRRQANINGYVQVVEDVFNWAPIGIELEEDE